MAERKPNRTCTICGRRYYACQHCTKYGSWRSVACSPACYAEYAKLCSEKPEEKPAAKAEPKEPKETKKAKEPKKPAHEVSEKPAEDRPEPNEVQENTEG